MGICIKKLFIKNFTLFKDETLEFAKDINIIYGENGAGKSHLLKLLYSLLSVENDILLGNILQYNFKCEKLKHLLFNGYRADYGLPLASDKGLFTTQLLDIELKLNFEQKKFDKSILILVHNNVTLTNKSKEYTNIDPVFLAPNELLTIYPQFLANYEKYHTDFEEISYNTCKLLGQYRLKDTKMIDSFLKELEEVMGGKLILKKNNRFYIRDEKGDDLEINLVAEGFRKVGMLYRFLQTGALGDGEQSYFFWDEPETNLNPKIMQIIAKLLLQITRLGIQIFISTHDIYLLREFKLLLEQEEFSKIDKRYFALEKTSSHTKIYSDNKQISPVLSLDESSYQADKILKNHFLK